MIKVHDSNTLKPLNTTPMLKYKTFLDVSGKKLKSHQSNYDSFKSPPDIFLALRHGYANRVCEDEQPPLLHLDSMNYLDEDDYEDNFVQQKPINAVVRFQINSKSQNKLLESETSDNSMKFPDKVIQYCPCCGKKLFNCQMPLSVNLNHLCHLGVTYPLYFQFIKKCFILLVIQFVMSGWYNLAINLYGDTCRTQNNANFICQGSIMNIRQEQDTINLQVQSLSNLFTVLIVIVLVEFFKVNQEINRYFLEKHRITPADFTIELKGLLEDTTLEDVEEFIYHAIGKTDEVPEICKIYFIFDMDPYCTLYQNKILLHKQRNEQLALQRKGISNDQSKGVSNDIQIERLDAQIAEVDERLKEIEDFLSQFAFKSKSIILSDYQDQQISVPLRLLKMINREELKFSGRVLVTLNKSENVKQIVEQWRMNLTERFWYRLYKFGMKRIALKHLGRFQYKGNFQTISRAAEPSDIIWQNIGSRKPKIKQRIFSSAMIVLVLTLSFGGLVSIKRNIKAEQDIQSIQVWQILLSFTASTIVALTNTLIGIIIRKFAGLETHKKQTNYFVSVGKSLSYLFFVNMVLTTMASNLLFRVLLYLIAYQYQQHRPQIGFPFNLEGLVNDFFFLFITNTFLSSLFNYYDILWGWKMFQRHRQLKLGELSSLSQREANSLFEGHPADMALRYANVLKLMYFTAMVSGFVPIGIPLSMAGLVVLYWVDKYLLLRRYVCKNYLDSQLANAMMDCLPLYPMFLSMGNMLTTLIPVLKEQNIIDFEWPNVYAQPYFYTSLCGLIVSVCYRYLVRYSLIKNLYFKIFSILIPKKLINTTYNNQKSKFTSDYEVYHPALREYFLPTNTEIDKNTPQLLKSIRQAF